MRAAPLPRAHHVLEPGDGVALRVAEELAREVEVDLHAAGRGAVVEGVDAGAAFKVVRARAAAHPVVAAAAKDRIGAAAAEQQVGAAAALEDVAAAVTLEAVAGRRARHVLDAGVAVARGVAGKAGTFQQRDVDARGRARVVGGVAAARAVEMVGPRPAGQNVIHVVAADVVVVRRADDVLEAEQPVTGGVAGATEVEEQVHVHAGGRPVVADGVEPVAAVEDVGAHAAGGAGRGRPARSRCPRPRCRPGCRCPPYLSW